MRVTIRHTARSTTVSILPQAPPVTRTFPRTRVRNARALNRARRIAAGLCIDCPNRRITYTRRCDECQRKEHVRDRQQRQRVKRRKPVTTDGFLRLRTKTLRGRGQSFLNQLKRYEDDPEVLRRLMERHTRAVAAARKRRKSW